MRLTLTVSALAMVAVAGSPALAQTTPVPAANSPQYFCPADVSKGARGPLAAYNQAVAAGDAAAIAKARTAAAAAVKSDVDRCVLGQVDLNVSVKANDDAAIATKAEALAANPAANKAMIGPMLLDAAKMRYNAKDYTAAAALLGKASALAPNNGEALMLLADARAKSGGAAEAPTIAAKAISLEKAAGRQVPENWYRHAVAFALDAKSPVASDLARDWVAAYPSNDSWRNSLQILVQSNRFADAELVDVYRLKAATKAFAGASDLGDYAYITSKLGFPGETETALKTGIADGTIKSSNADIAGMLKAAQGKVAADKASLAAETAKALSSGNAKRALAYGDAQYGYGNFAKAAEVYRSALDMSGADAATANLRLGMALAMAGDRAGAEAALKAVTGTRSAIAQFWLAYLATRG